MVNELEYKDKNDILDIINQYNKDKNNLITILQEVQKILGFLPHNAIYFLSEELKMSPAEIYGVATFYTQFKFEEIGKYLIVCCDGTACHVKGSPLILNFIENYLGIKPGETSNNKIYTLESVACLGCCAISPVCIINGDTYGDLTTNKIKRILNKLEKEIKD
ncbi:MAG: NADH-quinone oxidoreductase subunit NuoE [Candidatus Lokiarchaeota archaeon]|nr:NADH-quinone oxidoreductase subunit NuoE [Candidatus Lokiarchaeota archaeon]